MSNVSFGQELNFYYLIGTGEAGQVFFSISDSWSTIWAKTAPHKGPNDPIRCSTVQAACNLHLSCKISSKITVLWLAKLFNSQSKCFLSKVSIYLIKIKLIDNSLKAKQNELERGVVWLHFVGRKSFDWRANKMV